MNILNIMDTCVTTDNETINVAVFGASPELWVHHCAPAGDSACPVSSPGLSSVTLVRVGALPWRHVSPMGFSFGP